MDNDLNTLKRTFKNLKNKRLSRCLILTIILLALGLAILFITRTDQSPIDGIPCRISKDQKNFLTSRVKAIASCGTTSKITIYKALKAHFKYETIGKMPCDQFDEAENVLNDMKQRFCP